MNDTWYDMGLDADMDWMYNHKGKKNGVEGEKIMHNTFYEKMPEDFINAVVTIMEYCQNEDCDDDCSQCPHPLSEIRCGDRGHIIEIINEQIVKYNNKNKSVRDNRKGAIRNEMS